MKSAMAQARVAALLARHLLHVMARQRARVLVLWGALVVALGIGVGLLGFVTSIEDSYRERGQAVGGISDIQVKAIDRSSLPPRLADLFDRPERLTRVPDDLAAIEAVVAGGTVREGVA